MSLLHWNKYFFILETHSLLTNTEQSTAVMIGRLNGKPVAITESDSLGGVSTRCGIGFSELNHFSYLRLPMSTACTQQ